MVKNGNNLFIGLNTKLNFGFSGELVTMWQLQKHIVQHAEG